MLSTYASNAILSKTRAMYGKRLTATNYADLLNCHTVGEIATYLKHSTNYSSILADLNESDIHRGQLEIVLRKKLFYDFAKLGRYELSIGEYLSEYIISRSEIEQIMHSLMLLEAGRSNEYLYAMPVFFNKHTHINLPALAKMKDYDDFLGALKNSSYYELLAPFKPKPGENMDLTLIETTLYTYLYNTVLGVVRKYTNKTTQAELNDIFYSHIDLTNFVRLMRLKKYYHANPNAIRSSLLPFGALKKKHIEAMIEAKDSDEVLAIMKTTWLGKKIANTEYSYIDKILDKIKFLKCKHNIRFSVNPPVVMLSYIFLTEIELSNIINIIEGVRYQLPPNEILKMLVFQKNDIL